MHIGNNFRNCCFFSHSMPVENETNKAMDLATLTKLKATLKKYYCDRFKNTLCLFKPIDLGEASGFMPLQMTETDWKRLYVDENMSKHYFLCAPPGGGKTALLHKIAVDSLSNDLHWGFAWTVLLRFRDLAQAERAGKINSETSLEDCVKYFCLDLIRKEERLNQQQAKEIVNQANLQNGLLLLLDGLDEYEWTPVLIGLFKRLCECSFVVISGRQYAKSNLIRHHPKPSEVTQINIEGFLPEVALDYATLYFADDPLGKGAKECIDGLLSGNVSLTKNPLFLELLCHGQSKQLGSQEVPLSLGKIYDDAVLEILRRNQMRRYPATNAELLTADFLRNSIEWCFLTKLAQTTFKANQAVISYDSCATIFDKLTQEVPQRRLRLAQDMSNEDRLRTQGMRLAIMQSGVLQSNGEDAWDEQTYEFLHLGFQEYLAAQGFLADFRDFCSFNCDQKEPDIRQFFQQHKMDGRYNCFWNYVYKGLRQGMETYMYQILRNDESGQQALPHPGFWQQSTTNHEREYTKELSLLPLL